MILGALILLLKHSDHLVRAWHHSYGLPIIITNCSNNYGPYQFPEKLIPLSIIKALNRETIPVYGKGDNIRDWLLEDHIDGIARNGILGVLIVLVRLQRN